jgi:hypothetical protein
MDTRPYSMHSRFVINEITPLTSAHKKNHLLIAYQRFSQIHQTPSKHLFPAFFGQKTTNRHEAASYLCTPGKERCSKFFGFAYVLLLRHLVWPVNALLSTKS